MSWFWDRCYMRRLWRLIFLAKGIIRIIGPIGPIGLMVLCCLSAGAQSLQSKANDIRAAMDARDFSRAETLVREVRSTDQAAFTLNSYDYLLARLLERRGARSEASSLYLAMLERNSIVAQYALWHLSLLAKSSGDLPLERQYITRLLVSFPGSALTSRARERLIDSHLESGDYRAAIALLKPIASTTSLKGRGSLARLGVGCSTRLIPRPAIPKRPEQFSTSSSALLVTTTLWLRRLGWMHSIRPLGQSQTNSTCCDARVSTYSIVTGPKRELTSCT